MMDLNRRVLYIQEGEGIPFPQKVGFLETATEK